VFVSLHGEIEDMAARAKGPKTSIGYWAFRWMSSRRPDSAIRLVVIDDFIKQKLLEDYPEKLSDDQVFVAHHPVLPMESPPQPATAPPLACFIGYRTTMKGFDAFRRLSELAPAAKFVAIGAGKVEDLADASSKPLGSNDEYLNAIAACSAAIFPYLGGYSCSLSAAALDALSAGVHIVATPRPCFIGLQENLGADVITICETMEEAAAQMRTPDWFSRRTMGRDDRLTLLRRSKYGLDAVGATFERLLTGVDRRAGALP
jgi:glycosyltransferase involved in cell wall biosynthesis